MIALFRFGWLGWMVVLFATSTAAAESWRVRVQGNGTELGETPVVAELKPPIAPGRYDLLRQDEKPLPAQVFQDEGKTFLATILRHVPARAEEVYSLRVHDSAAPSAEGVALVRQGENVTIRIGGALFTEYLVDSGAKPCFFPVIGPTGAPFTRAFPIKKAAGEDTDHFHQRSFWFSIDKVNGVLFWASDPLNPPNPKFGTIKETAKKAVLGGPALGLLRTTDDWLDHDGKKVCEDERTVRVYETARARVLDFDITLKATNGPVTFGDTKEGMFGLRVASSMDVKRKMGGKITNAEGITDDAAWGKASPWVDYAGPLEGQTVGIAMLNHPDSFRYPTTWHVRDYGLLAANPFGWKAFGMKESGEYTLPSGESLRFKYRVILHTGDTASAHLSDQFAAYATPPQVTVQAE